MSVMTVSDLMTSDVEALRDFDTLDVAGALMHLGRIRHLPVTDEQGRLTGLVTHRDLLGAASELLQSSGGQFDDSKVPVSDIMIREVETVTPDTPALQAAQTMMQYKFGCLPVVEDEKLVGIITEADFVVLAIKELSDPGR